jgi:hypothetical protein
MGIFGKLFNKEKEYPSIDSTSPASKHLDKVREPLGAWAKSVSHPIEVVPTEKATYIIVGTPPSQFGILWIEDGKLNVLKKVADQKGISPAEFMKYSETLREAYERSQPESRFSTVIADKKIIITPSENLGKEVDRVIRAIAG